MDYKYYNHQVLCHVNLLLSLNYNINSYIYIYI
uniref:Uncharacterized protein n=1 Tax=Heterorhabditis bacteriophora TaxID=37862 RepID=A0A1I7X431_HETBA